MYRLLEVYEYLIQLENISGNIKSKSYKDIHKQAVAYIKPRVCGIHARGLF